MERKFRAELLWNFNLKDVVVGRGRGRGYLDSGDLELQMDNFMKGNWFPEFHDRDLLRFGPWLAILVSFCQQGRLAMKPERFGQGQKNDWARGRPGARTDGQTCTAHIFSFYSITKKKNHDWSAKEKRTLKKNDSLELFLTKHVWKQPAWSGSGTVRVLT